MRQIRIVSAVIAVFFAVLLFPAPGWADPCLIVYPTGPVEYRYDTNEYYTVTFGHPLYDQAYDRGGEVLIELNTDEIPLDIYQALNLTGFKASTDGQDGYFFVGYAFDLVIDGWNNSPTTYENIFLVFEPSPGWCQAPITVDGELIEGNQFPCGNLVVSTPTGPNYSDTIIKSITWSGCIGVHIWAFADENGNGVMDGGECFTAFSHDITVPVKKASWGLIKSLYR